MHHSKGYTIGYTTFTIMLIQLFATLAARLRKIESKQVVVQGGCGLIS